MKPDLIEGDIEHIDLYMKALEIAKECHEGQKDKGGHDYIGHPIRVSDRCMTEKASVAALLHDTMEDSDMTSEKLSEIGFPADVIEAVEVLTKPRYDNYDDYIKRVGTNPIAREVKIADLEDNMDVTRLQYPLTDKDLLRLNKYLKSWKYLKSLY
jgi:(p)ppGpp synthase/HD superfamily hydrolase